jgi:predicted O-methyltransferase YrrM
VNLLQKIVRADENRRSRFHDLKGRLHLEPELLRSAGSTAARRFLRKYPALPWLTYKAVARLSGMLDGVSVLEFGAGTSTAWLARHAAKVVSLENDISWLEMVRGRLSGLDNVELLPILKIEDYAAALKDRPPFDLYFIDCQARPEYGVSTEDLRIACLQLSVDHCGGKAAFVIDNTDANPQLDREVDRHFAGRKVERLAGWVPGILHPNETTIVPR